MLLLSSLTATVAMFASLEVQVYSGFSSSSPPTDTFRVTDSPVMTVTSLEATTIQFPSTYTIFSSVWVTIFSESEQETNELPTENNVTKKNNPLNRKLFFILKCFIISTFSYFFFSCNNLSSDTMPSCAFPDRILTLCDSSHPD